MEGASGTDVLSTGCGGVRSKDTLVDSPVAKLP
jgi:hypothetical protein